jgi:hypothetical protein
MTKAKARERAKARKAKNPAAVAKRPGPDLRPGHFDPGPGSISGPKAGAQVKSFAKKRGAARSR